MKSSLTIIAALMLTTQAVTIRKDNGEQQEGVPAEKPTGAATKPTEAGQGEGEIDNAAENEEVAGAPQQDKITGEQ